MSNTRCKWFQDMKENTYRIPCILTLLIVILKKEIIRQSSFFIYYLHIGGTTKRIVPR
jgi:hypothetical protein